MKKNDNFKRIFHSFIIIFINIFYIITFSNCYCYASAEVQMEDEREFLGWIDSSEIETNNKVRVLNFFKLIRTNAENDKASSIIHSLAGNSYYDDKDEDNNPNSNRLSFLDTIPNNTSIKTQILSDLNKVANLAKEGNIKEIVSLINKKTEVLLKNTNFLAKEEKSALPIIFPIDRKDSLIKFFRRMDNDITKNTLHYLFDIHEAINEENNIIEANSSLERLKANGIVLYDPRSSILNLEDFGAGYRSFNIWLSELNNLLETFNLKDNKPRINELLSYLNEANVSYFKPKINMPIVLFYSSEMEK